MFKSFDDKDEVEEIFGKSDWGVSTAKNTPAYFVRALFQSRGITASIFDSLLNVWVRQYEDNDKHRSSTKSNTCRMAKKRFITWIGLLRIAQIVRIKELTFSMEARWSDDVITYGQQIINVESGELKISDLIDNLVVALKDPNVEFRVDEYIDNLVVLGIVESTDSFIRAFIKRYKKQILAILKEEEA